MIIFHSISLSHRSCNPHLILFFVSSDLGSFGFDSFDFGSGRFTSLANHTGALKTLFEETDDSLLHTLALCGSVHLDPLETSRHDPSGYPYL